MDGPHGKCIDLILFFTVCLEMILWRLRSTIGNCEWLILCKVPKDLKLGQCLDIDEMTSLSEFGEVMLPSLHFIFPFSEPQWCYRKVLNSTSLGCFYHRCLSLLTWPVKSFLGYQLTLLHRDELRSIKLWFCRWILLTFLNLLINFMSIALIISSNFQ